MAIQNIPVYDAPFQGGINGTDIDTVTAGIVTTVLSTNISFVNDGYTILVVNVGATANIMYVQSVPDNAGRIGNIGTVDGGGVPLTVPLAANVTRIYGPFRPLWWNFGGVVNITFVNVTTVKVSALRLQF